MLIRAMAAGFAVLLAVPAWAAAPAPYNPFVVDPNATTSIDGTPDTTGAINDVNKTFQQQGLNSYQSIQNKTGTNATNSSLAKDLGVTQQQLTDAQKGQTASWSSTATQTDMLNTIKKAGYGTAIIQLSATASYNEAISAPTGYGKAPTIVYNTVLARTGVLDPTNPAPKLAAWLTAQNAVDISPLIATKMVISRVALPTGGNAMLATYQCGIDTKLGTDSCCGLASVNVKFHLRAAPGIADNLDVTGLKDAALLDKNAVPITTQTPVDVLARLLLCTSVSAMDNVNAGSAMVAGEGVPQ